MLSSFLFSFFLSCVSVASLSNQSPSLLSSGPIRREREAACFLQPLGFSAIDPPIFLYSVFNKRVLKVLPSANVIFQVFNLFGSVFFSQVCSGTNQLLRRQNTKNKYFQFSTSPNSAAV